MRPLPRLRIFEERPWLRDYAVGLGLSFFGGLMLAALARWSHSYGYAFALCVPLAMGAALGYTAGFGRASRVFLVVLLPVAGIGGAVVAGLAGLLCGAVAACIMLLPTLIGVWIGAAVRARRARRGLGTDPAPACLLLIAGCALLLGLESRLELPQTEERVVTERVLGVPAGSAWEHLLFYEEVELEPPLFARLGLPEPLRTEGRIRGVGDIKRCLYSSGYLRKRITAFEPERLLAFEVIEQVGIEDRSVELRRGRIELEELPGRLTRITLTTVYRPLLSARPIWRPFEQSLAHVLHDHVIDGMSLAAGAATGTRIARAGP